MQLFIGLHDFFSSYAIARQTQLVKVKFFQPYETLFQNFNVKVFSNTSSPSVVFLKIRSIKFLCLRALTKNPLFTRFLELHCNAGHLCDGLHSGALQNQLVDFSIFRPCYEIIHCLYWRFIVCFLPIPMPKLITCCSSSDTCFV